MWRALIGAIARTKFLAVDREIILCQRKILPNRELFYCVVHIFAAAPFNRNTIAIKTHRLASMRILIEARIGMIDGINSCLSTKPECMAVKQVSGIASASFSAQGQHRSSS